jgi:hypothetical protein
MSLFFFLIKNAENRRVKQVLPGEDWYGVGTKEVGKW